MAFFTIRIIIAKVSGNNENFLYFKEKKDNIYTIAQVFTFATLLILFMPNQEKLEFLTKAWKNASDPNHPTTLDDLAKNPEVMVSGADNVQDLENHFLYSDVLVCGPGMYENYWSEQLLFKLLAFAVKNQTPTLLDAGALRLLSKKPFSNMSLPKDIVLTPHPGEASSLLGVSTDVIQNDRLRAAKELNAKFGGIVVLKGHGTIICDSKESYLCCSGGPELAIAGSGDVLSGLIGSLMAQGLKPIDAAMAGVALHGNAGESFARSIGAIGLAASELIPHIRNALN
jgi:NAD(P)H-hydrate epimerase